MPSFVVTVIVALPGFWATTLPSCSTVATSGLLLLHVTSLFAAASGVTVATSLLPSPTESSTLLVFSPTPVTATGVSLTVTSQLAVLPPSSVVTVIVVVPGVCPTTLPFWSTFAMLSLSLLHVTFLLVAFSGLKWAVSWAPSPSESSSVLLFSPTLCTGTPMCTLTFTVHVAVLLPSAVVTVMIA